MIRDMPDYPVDEDGEAEYTDYSEDVNTFGGDDDETDTDSE